MNLLIRIEKKKTERVLESFLGRPGLGRRDVRIPFVDDAEIPSDVV